MGRNWWLLIGLIVVLGLVARHPLLLLVGLLLALVGGASLLWARYCLAGVSYQRRFSATRLFYGEETEMAVQVVNAKPLPLAWLITVDDIPADVELLSGKVVASHQARRRLLVNTLSLRWYERVTRRYRLRVTRRGVWHFGPVQLSTGDIFGFSVKRTSLEETQTITVYPKMVPLTALGLADLHPFGDLKTRRRVIEDPLRSVGAREYVPGDSFRHIHWKATARRRELQTKVLEPSADRRLVLFLNTRTAEYIDEGIDRDVLELAVSTAASIARWAWERDYPVGLFANSAIQASGKPVEIRPGNQPDQLIRILEALTHMEDDGRWTLATTLQLNAMSLPYGTSIVIITAVANRRLLQTLITLQRREYGITVVTLGNARLDSMPGVQSYHIDEHKVWHEVEALALD